LGVYFPAAILEILVEISEIFSGANSSTSCKSLVMIGPVTSKFKNKKMKIVAPFDDRRSFGTLAFRKGLHIKSLIAAR